MHTSNLAGTTTREANNHIFRYKYACQYFTIPHASTIAGAHSCRVKHYWLVFMDGISMR
jgi:hypothetical protein